MKNLRNLLISICAFCLFLANANALSVVVKFVQNDSASETVLETTRVFEDSIMNSFFEFGDIICESPVFVSMSDKNRDDELHNALVEASDGYMDYMVTLTMNYDRSGLINPESAEISGIKDISWKSVLVSVNKQVATGNATPGISTSTNKESEIRAFAAEIARQIRQGLKK